MIASRILAEIDARQVDGMLESGAAIIGLEAFCVGHVKQRAVFREGRRRPIVANRVLKNKDGSKSSQAEERADRPLKNGSCGLVARAKHGGMDYRVVM